MLNFFLLRLSIFIIIFYLFIFFTISFYFLYKYDFNIIFFLLFENDLFENFDLNFFFQYFKFNIIFFFFKYLFFLMLLSIFIHSYKGISHIFEEYLDLKLQRNIKNKIILNNKITIGFLFKKYILNFFLFISILLLII